MGLSTLGRFKVELTSQFEEAALVVQICGDHKSFLPIKKSYKLNDYAPGQCYGNIFVPCRLSKMKNSKELFFIT